jgi:hypothetical protein
METEVIFAEIVGYLKNHSIKELLEVVLRAIELLDAK